VRRGLLPSHLGHNLTEIRQCVRVVALALSEDAPEGLPLLLDILFLLLLAARCSVRGYEKRIDHTEDPVIDVVVFAFLGRLVIK
jgi:hypothetical protein